MYICMWLTVRCNRVTGTASNFGLLPCLRNNAKYIFVIRLCNSQGTVLEAGADRKCSNRFFTVDTLRYISQLSQVILQLCNLIFFTCGVSDKERILKNLDLYMRHETLSLGSWELALRKYIRHWA